MEIYVHRPTDQRVELLAIEPTMTIAQAVALTDGESVWLEASDTVLDTNASIKDAGISHRDHLHVNRCRKVSVVVNFNGEAKSHPFSPAARIDRVFDWAVGKRAYDLTPTDATEHVLQICGSKLQPDESDHIGTFARKDCATCFDLVTKVRFEG